MIPEYVTSIIQIQGHHIVVQLLKYVNSTNKWQRWLAITALGKIDHFKALLDGKDVIQCLLIHLSQLDFKEEQQEVQRTVQTLGRCKDPRAYPLVQHICLQMGSAFLSANKKAIANIPHQAISKSKAQKFYQLGKKKVEQKSFEEAIGYLGNAIVLNPTYYVFYELRGEAYIGLKKWHRAGTDYDKSIALYKKSAESYGSRGAVYHYLKQYQKALKFYDKAIEINPQNANTLSNRAAAYYGLGKYKQAIVDYTKAIKLDPKEARYRKNRAYTYLQTGKYKKAIAGYSKAIKQKADAEMYLQRAIAYHKDHNFKTSMADLNKALEIKPRWALVYVKRGFIQAENKKFTAALKDFNIAIKLQSKHKTVYRERGLAYKNNKQPSKAILDFKKAIELNPKDVQAHLHLADLYREQKKFSKSLQYYNQLIEINSHVPLSYMGRAKVYLSQKKYSKTIADLIHATYNTDRKYLTQANKLSAITYVKWQKPQKAIQSMRAYLKEKPDDPIKEKFLAYIKKYENK